MVQVQLDFINAENNYYFIVEAAFIQKDDLMMELHHMIFLFSSH